MIGDPFGILQSPLRVCKKDESAENLAPVCKWGLFLIEEDLVMEEECPSSS